MKLFANHEGIAVRISVGEDQVVTGADLPPPLLPNIKSVSMTVRWGELATLRAEEPWPCFYLGSRLTITHQPTAKNRGAILAGQRRVLVDGRTFGPALSRQTIGPGQVDKLLCLGECVEQWFDYILDVAP